MAPTAKQRQIVILEAAEMQAAVAAEDFERAARLRDRINNLRGEWDARAQGRQPGQGRLWSRQAIGGHPGSRTR